MIVHIPDIILVCVGPMKDRNLSALFESYISRLKHEAKITIKEIRDGTRETEDAAMYQCLGKFDGYTIAMGEEGAMLNSHELSDLILKVNKRMVFIIGGHNGLSNGLKQRSDKLVSLSRFTFTHEIARMLLAEQLYRACTILHNKNYHRDSYGA